MNKVCVFCSSSDNVDEKYFQHIELFCSQLAELKVPLVYGGAGCGLMGRAADAALENGGSVEGIIPDFLADMREVLHEGLDETVIVGDMFARKQVMFDRSTMFVTFPGGIGTLDEFFEVITWRQLGRLKGPMLLVNIAGFWDPLLSLLEHTRQTGMLREEIPSLFDICQSGEEALQWVKKEIEVSCG